MPNAILRANARPLPVARPPLSPPLRRRLEAALENLVALLDELDGDPDFEEQHDREDDEAERSGIADRDGFVEQLEGEPWLGATLALDQRVAWRPGCRLVMTDDGASQGRLTGWISR
jgi:hypothetical protein